MAYNVITFVLLSNANEFQAASAIYLWSLSA